MHLVLRVLGYELLAIELAGNEEASETDDVGIALGADTEVMDVTTWRDDNDESDLPPRIIAIGSRHRSRDSWPDRFGFAAGFAT